jgi:prophage DNA circulation protein
LGQLAETVVARLARRIAESAPSYAVQGQRPNREDGTAFVSEQEDVVSPFARDMMEAIAALAMVPANPEEAWQALDLLTAFTPERTANTINTGSVRAEAGLVDEVGAFVRRASLLLQARVMAASGFSSRKSGIAARAAMAEGFEREIAAAQSVEIELALTDARNAMANFLTKAVVERKTITVENKVALPAVVIATRLYGDANRDAELVARNAAPHPNFMPMSIEAERV